nr:fatty acid binding protein a [Hymenolepis microstoma]
MERFLGGWKLEKTENFDEVMKELGVNILKRTAGNTVKPVHIFEDLGNGMYRFKTESTFTKTSCDFKLGEEFDEHTSDGRDLKSVITIDGEVMKQVQKGEGKTTYVERVVEGNLLKTTVKVNDVVSTRIYTKTKN